MEEERCLGQRQETTNVNHGLLERLVFKNFLEQFRGFFSRSLKARKSSYSSPWSAPFSVSIFPTSFLPHPPSLLQVGRVGANQQQDKVETTENPPFSSKNWWAFSKQKWGGQSSSLQNSELSPVGDCFTDSG